MSFLRVTFDRDIKPTTLKVSRATLPPPNGTKIAASNVKAVDGTGGKSFDVVFAIQSAPGTYTLRVGPNVKDRSEERSVGNEGTYRLPREPTTTTATKIVRGVAMGPTT